MKSCHKMGKYIIFMKKYSNLNLIFMSGYERKCQFGVEPFNRSIFQGVSI